MILTKKPHWGVAEMPVYRAFRLGVLGDIPLTSWQRGGYFFEEREKMAPCCPACYFNHHVLIKVVISTKK